MVEVGITATRRGLTTEQLLGVATLAERIERAHPREKLVAHVGDCVGGDCEIAYLLDGRGWTIELHPPDNDRFRAHLEDKNLRIETVHRPRPYLDRNEDIMRGRTYAIAAPKWGKASDDEPPKGTRGEGTLQAMNIARRERVPLAVVHPDGTATGSRLKRQVVV